MFKIIEVKSFLRLITELNIWVAIAVSALCVVTYMDMSMAIQYDYIFLVFFGTISMYNFQRLIRMHIMVQEVYHLRARWYKKLYKWNLLGLMLCIAPILYFGMQIQLTNYWPMLLAAVISLAYPLPVYKSSKGWMRLRDFPLFKIVLVSLVWAIVSVWIPRQLTMNSWNFNGVLQFLERFIFIFAITIPFDIRDVRYDKQPTIPKLIGVKGAKLLSLVLWIAFFLLFLRNHSIPEIQIGFYVSGFVLFVIGSILILKSHPLRDPLYYSFLIEALPIMQWGLYWLFLSF